MWPGGAASQCGEAVRICSFALPVSQPSHRGHVRCVCGTKRLSRAEQAGALLKLGQHAGLQFNAFPIRTFRVSPALLHSHSQYTTRVRFSSSLRSQNSGIFFELLRYDATDRSRFTNHAWCLHAVLLSYRRNGDRTEASAIVFANKNSLQAERYSFFSRFTPTRRAARWR